MQKRIQLFILIIAISNISFSQSLFVRQWDNTFGGNTADELGIIKQTPDGGFILAGYSFSGISGNKTAASNGSSDYWIVKTNSTGIKLWDKSFGGSNLDQLYSIALTPEHGFLLAGYSSSPVSGDKSQPSQGGSDFWVVKIDSAGNKIWDKTFGGNDNDNLQSIQLTSDGDYILAGSSYSNVSGDKSQPSKGMSDYWIIKIDSAGNKIWDKDFGGNDLEILYSVKETSQHGFILAGQSWSGINGDKTQSSWGFGDYWIVKIDSSGNKIWDKDFGTTDIDECFDVEITGNDFLIGGHASQGTTGNKTSPGWGATDYWILKVDSSGTKLWDKTYGGTDFDEFNFLVKALGNNFLLCGMSYSPISGEKNEGVLGLEQAWIIKIDSSGSIFWDKTAFTNGHDELSCAVQNSKACYVFGVMTNSGFGGDKTHNNWDPTIQTDDYWLIQYCDTSFTSSFSQFPNGNLDFLIHPNPANDFIQITFHTPQNYFEVEILNLLGKTILKTNNKSKIDISLFSNGIYLLKLKTESKDYVYKFIKASP